VDYNIIHWVKKAIVIAIGFSFAIIGTGIDFYLKIA